jgi:RND superfamily putative drug exporter
MARFLDRLGRDAARHHWIVIGLWLVIAVGLVFAAEASGGHTVDNFTIPGTQSQEAADLLEDRFPSQSGDTASVVYEASQGKVTDPANIAAIGQVQDALAKLPHATGVTGPATPTVGAAFVSQDGTIGYTQVQFNESAPDLGTEAFEEIEQASQPAVDAGLRVEYGGPVVDYGTRSSRPTARRSA